MRGKSQNSKLKKVPSKELREELKLKNLENSARSDKSQFTFVYGNSGKFKSLPVSALKEDILGEKYELSLAFVTPKVSRKLNNTYRGRDNPTNILSFPLSKNSGEIVLCLDVIKKEYRNWEKTLYEFTGFLVIHGMLHLKGLDHGSIMEKQEQKFYAKYFYRDKSRFVDSTSNSRRIHKR